MPSIRSVLSLAPALVAALPAALAQSVPCEKYRLPNGLTVILHEDHRVPTVTINTWFRVGAKDEPPRRSGFAHLFEHLMFMGTERVPGNAFDTIMEGAGGSNNASTTEDRTNYFSEGPAASLPTLLWLDADRLEDVGRTMDQAKLDRQREVVCNEIRQNVDNAPYGRLERVKFGLMWPPGHPYRDTTYGTHEDLESAQVDDVRDFFTNFYVPANASLVVAGDFDSAAVKPLIEQLYGSLPAAPAPTRRIVEPAKLDRVVRASLIDRVQNPMVAMCWHAPKAYADGTAELDLLAEVLASGNDSRLYRRLVEKERIATEVSADYDGLALGGLFTITVLGVPGVDLGRIEAIVDEELGRVTRDGVVADELERRKVGREVATLAQLQSVGRKADLLNHYEFVWGEPDSFARDLQRYRDVTPDRVKAIAAAVLSPGARAIVHVVPAEAERPKTARDTRPADFAAKPFAPPAPVEFALANGTRVLHWHRPDLPLVNVRLLVPSTSGLLVEPATCGVTSLAADMMTEGAGDLDAAQFAAALEAAGASFHAWIEHESANASLSTLSRNFPRALHLMAEAVQRPRMGPEDFERAKRVRLADLRAGEERPGRVAAQVAARLLFGEGDPFAWPSEGTVETVEKLTLEAVAQCQRRSFAGPAILFVAGDITAEALRAALDREFGTRPADRGTGIHQEPPSLPFSRRQDPALRVAVVDRPDAPQTAVTLLLPAPTYRDPARIRLEVLAAALGGSFTSRLNQNLRELHGYTYGAGCAFALGPTRGWFGARTNVQTAVTGPALKELFAEFARLRREQGGDVTADEIAKVQRTMLAETAASFQTLGGAIGSAVELVMNGLPYEQLARDLAALTATTAEMVNQNSRADLDLDHGVLVLVGDKKKILEQIQGLGLPTPEERDARGRPVTR